MLDVIRVIISLVFSKSNCFRCELVITVHRFIFMWSWVLSNLFYEKKVVTAIKMSRKRKINNITSDDAIHDILRFVENEDSSEESDIEDIFGDDTNIQLEIQ